MEQEGKGGSAECLVEEYHLSHSIKEKLSRERERGKEDLCFFKGKIPEVVRGWISGYLSVK